MFARLICVLATLGLAAIGFTACDRPASPSATLQSQSSNRLAQTGPGGVSDTNLPSPPRTGRGQGEVSNRSDVSTIHWLGKKRLATDTNAASVMAIWNLPETARLGTQTLEKLALAPWRLLKNDAATNGAPVALLRPLLDDLVTEEWHLVIHHPTNQPAAWSLAIKLPAERFPLWQTNLSAVLESLTGAKATQTSDGFNCPSSILHPPSSDFVFRLSRTNDWIMLGFAPQYSKPETRNSELGNGSLQSALRRPPPVPTNWLSLSLDPAALNRAFSFGWSLPTNCPRVQIVAAGDGRNVQTRGILLFSEPHNLLLEPWTIPTNKLSEPLIGFTAVRGLRRVGLLSGLSPNLRDSVNQAFGWSMASTPFASYFALPVTNSATLVTNLSEIAIRDVNPAIKAARTGRFQPTPDGNGLVWTDLPYFAPFLRGDSDSNGDFIVSGFLGLPTQGGDFPRELLTQLGTDPDLVYYDWEATGAKTESVLHITQLLRFIFGRVQIPLDSAVMQFMRTLPNHLHESVTSARIVSPNRVEFTRRSSLGLSSLELNLVADWLAGSGFPRDLSSLETAPEPPQRRGRVAAPNDGAVPR